MLTRKEKGDIGLTKVLADLIEKGFSVSLPISEHLKYDLIAEKNGICKRVQVRFCSKSKGKLEVKLKSVWSNQNGVHVVKRKKSDYDLLAVFCPETKECYYIKDKEFDCGCTLTLRVDIPKKGTNLNTVRFAKDYLDIKE